MNWNVLGVVQVSSICQILFTLRSKVLLCNSGDLVLGLLFMISSHVGV